MTQTPEITCLKSASIDKEALESGKLNCDLNVCSTVAFEWASFFGLGGGHAGENSPGTVFVVRGSEGKYLRDWNALP
jgi:hypothetical protein